jgi:hypothetical protein
VLSYGRQKVTKICCLRKVDTVLGHGQMLEKEGKTEKVTCVAEQTKDIVGSQE